MLTWLPFVSVEQKSVLQEQGMLFLVNFPIIPLKSDDNLLAHTQY